MTIQMKTVFAVPMHCEGCTDDIKGALQPVDGVNNIKFDLENQLVYIEGSAPPSTIVNAIQGTGRDAIVRGSGEPNSSAVSILETFEPDKIGSPVRGLARLVKVSSTNTLVDLTLSGLRPLGTYYASIRTAGDISRGALSTGSPYKCLGPIDVDKEGSGQTFLIKDNLPIYEVIGRSLVVGQDKDCVRMFESDVVGVIARSAGVWQNEKTVCSCSGKTVWEERKDARSKGIA
ncbi:superoxide dismutase [Lipomyces oligophaga]|uniref:superoxide dismutase n=1 Tax=Lipomyces oligophaga TaxID=45792 RepID=UPI0034CD3013